MNLESTLEQLRRFGFSPQVKPAPAAAKTFDRMIVLWDETKTRILGVITYDSKTQRANKLA